MPVCHAVLHLDAKTPLQLCFQLQHNKNLDLGKQMRCKLTKKGFCVCLDIKTYMDILKKCKESA